MIYMPEEDFDPTAVAADISGLAGDLLKIAVDEGGTCTTRDFTKWAEIKNDTAAHHVRYHLYEHGLLEKIGADESADTPNPPNKYRITDRGRAVENALQSTPSPESPSPETVEELRDELKDQEETDDWLKGRVDELEAQVEEQQAFIENLKARMSNSS